MPLKICMESIYLTHSRIAISILAVSARRLPLSILTKVDVNFPQTTVPLEIYLRRIPLAKTNAFLGPSERWAPWPAPWPSDSTALSPLGFRKTRKSEPARQSLHYSHASAMARAPGFPFSRIRTILLGSWHAEMYNGPALLIGLGLRALSDILHISSVP